MAKPSSKGTKLQLSIASVFTDIAGLIKLDGPKCKVKTMDLTDLASSTGEERGVTGHVEGGMVSGQLFFDPVAATHQAMTDLLTTPAVASWKNKWSDAAATEWPYSGILLSFNPSAAVNQPLRADFEIELDGIVTYPT